MPSELQLELELVQKSSTEESSNFPISTTANESSYVNDSLQRTKQMMRAEIERMSHVTNTIDIDGETINNTKDQHVRMEDLVKNSKTTLSKIKKQDKEDFFVFIASVVFFVCVVIHVCLTRLAIFSERA